MYCTKRVIILSQGRSGSTLLQRILQCSIQDAHINGENHNFWGSILDAYDAWVNTCERQTDRGDGPYTSEDLFKPCWWNNFSQDEMLDHFRRLFDDMYLTMKYRVVGFKEIRVPHDPEHFDRLIYFFKKMFPDCLFVFTVRDIEDLVQSAWWDESDREYLTKVENNLRRGVEEHPESAFLLSYEEMTDEARVQKLFSFLGEPFEKDTYMRVMNNRLD